MPRRKAQKADDKHIDPNFVVGLLILIATIAMPFVGR